MSRQQDKRAIQRTSVKLGGFACVMFAFCFWVLPPLYTLFCEVTGLNGKVGSTDYQAVSTEVDETRKVSVKFIATQNTQMPWDFEPMSFSLSVHPGEAVTTAFLAKNRTAGYMAAQAVPSMAPKNALDYFHKTECFCFEQQILAPGEEAELGIRFIVDRDLPKAVNTITLSYTLFDITDRMQTDIEALKQARALEQAFSTGLSVDTQNNYKKTSVSLPHTDASGA